MRGCEAVQVVRLPCLVSFRLAAGLAGWVGESPIRSSRWMVHPIEPAGSAVGWLVFGWPVRI